MKVKIINKSKHNLPAYETIQSAGMDLRANIDEPVTIQPKQRVLIPTGLFIALPEGYEAQMRPRSGLAIKHGLNLINCIGTIDADYRAEWGIPVVNQGLEPVWIEDGERICQAVLNKVEQIEWEVVESLNATERAGGFGSTGVK